MAEIEHSTERGYYQHRRRKDRPCEACRAARREAEAARRGAADAARQALYQSPPLPLGYDPDPAVIGEPIKGRELREGDVLMWLGRPHTVLSLQPYTGSLLGQLGPDARLAVCDGDLRLPVGPNATIRIRPRRQEAA